MKTMSTLCILIPAITAIGQPAVAASDAAKPVTWQGEVLLGYQHDSNVGVKELDDSSNQSDTLWLGKAKLQVTVQASERLTLTGGYQYQGQAHQTLRQYDVDLHTFHADVAYRFDALTSGLSHYQANASLAGEGFLRYGLTQWYVSSHLSPGLYWRGALQHSKKQFDGLPERDASHKGVTGDLFWFSGQGNRMLNLGYSFDRENAVSDGLDYQGHQLRLQLNQSWPDTRSKLELGWRFQSRDYRGTLEHTDEARYDKRHTLFASWTMPLWQQLMWSPRLERSFGASNLPNANYDETLAALQLSMSF